VKAGDEYAASEEWFRVRWKKLSESREFCAADGVDEKSRKNT
jgi:hypothetical protein